MNENADESDHRHGRYSMNGDSVYGEDLAKICHRLALSGPLEPLLRELKCKTTQKIPQYLNMKESSRKHVLTMSCERKNVNQNNDDAGDVQQLGGRGVKNCTFGQESWGRDSGARDLSPEPHHRDMCSGEKQHVDIESGTTPMINLSNKLQVAALKTAALELSARLMHSEREKEQMQQKLNDANEEKERSQRRLESVGAANENRITEMHSIVVELNKKLKSKNDNESDGSVHELSSRFQDGSVYNYELKRTNVDQESHTELLDTKFVQPTLQLDSPCSLPPPATSSQLQIQAMHEEILHLRGRVSLLQSQLESNRDKLDEDHNEIFNSNDQAPPSPSPRERSNYTGDDLCETAEQDFKKQSTAKYMKTSKVALPSSRGVSPVVQLFGSVNSLNKPLLKSLSAETPVSKMAERVWLRRNIEGHHIVGADIVNGGQQCTTEIAEHIVSKLLQSDINVNHDSAHLQNEVKRLDRHIEHLRIQNSVLAITLAESKAHCNHLYLLHGKYESNAVELHQALNCSDRAIEAYDVMLASLESRLRILEDTIFMIQ